MTVMSGTEQGVSVSVETITPEVAAEWLMLNKVNRNLRKRRVESYADQMRRGLWKLTGEPIQKNGSNLLNGQHRLSACVLAEVPFTTVVVRGVSTEAMTVMDSGLPRSVGDALRFSGVLNQHQVAAVVRLVLMWKGGFIRDSGRAQTTLSRDDLVNFALENEEALHEAANDGRRISQAVGLPASAWATVVYLTRDADVEAARQFADLIVTGDKLAVGDPIHALRSWATSSVVGKRSRTKPEIIAVAVKAWNAWLAGETVRLLKWLPTEDAPEVSTP